MERELTSKIFILEEYTSKENMEEHIKEYIYMLKEKYPNKNLWMWTGFNYEKDLKDKEVMKYVDVLVDGQYVDQLRNPTLKWKGSSNQRVIDVQKSLNEGQIVLYDK